MDIAVDLGPTTPGVLHREHDVPLRQAILVALSAGLGYGFDSYAINIFGMLSPPRTKGRLCDALRARLRCL